MRSILCVLPIGLCAVLGCSETNEGGSGAGGMAGSGGTLSGGGGSAGTAGVAGGGASGSNAGGSSGSGGVGGSGGQNTAGAAGQGGAAGTGGQNGGGTGGAAGASGAAGAAGSGGAGGVAAFELISPAFTHVEACSAANHEPCNEWPSANLLQQIGGENMSPEMTWGPGPEGTLSYALILHDYSNGFTHWALWNLSAETLMLEAGMTTPPQGASQIGFGSNAGYAGPGADDHVYELRLYALNVASFTPAGNIGAAPDGNPGAVRGELENDPEGIVLGTSDLRGVTPPN